MNYYNFVNTILETAKSHKLVYEVGEGDIYEHLNSGDHKYPCVFLTVQNVDSNGSQMTVTGSLFYVDALLSDTSNKLQIQSTGMTTLQQIFMRLMDNYPDFELRTGRYTPFDEKFSDLCAGVFSNFTVSFMDDTCIFNDDIFEGDEPITPEPEPKYMTITVDDEVEGETVIKPTVTGTLSPNLQYRVNNGKWHDFIFGTSSAIPVFAGDCVQFKGVNENGISDISNYLNFAISKPVHLSGNIMSLIDGVGETTVIPNDYCFCYLFKNSKIKTVSNDFLPATTLTKGCYFALFSESTLENSPELPALTLLDSSYNSMFYNCKSLKTAPELHATVLDRYCYAAMFSGCTSLTNAPALQATELVENCYASMFQGCENLTQAPELPALTLVFSCYAYMFQNCKSLVNAPELPATQLAKECYESMFENCTSLVTAPSLPAMVLSHYCYDSMFSGCTALTTAPALPAKQLAYRCYGGMFQNCTSLVNAPALPANKLETVCYSNMFSGCENLTQAPELPALNLAEGCYNSMFQNCTSLVTATALPATQLASDCYDSMFSGCTALTTAPELHALNLAYCCYYYIFKNCTSLVTAPALPATELKERCYDSMFYGCENLIQAPELPATQLSVNCYVHMFQNCKSLVTAPALPATQLAKSCYISMFQGCENLTQAPELPANTLYDYCYMTMFSGCSKLNYVKSNASEITASNALNQWLLNVAPTGTFVKKYGVEYLINSPSGIPEGWTVVEERPKPEGKYMTITVDDAAGETVIKPTVTGSITPPNLQYRINSNGDWNDFVFGTTADIHVVAGDWVQFKGNNPNGIDNFNENCFNFSISDLCHLSGNVMSLIDGVGETLEIPNNYCFFRLFEYSKVKTISKDFLPATTLKSSCYSYMFADCTSLVNAPELPATTLADMCYELMFDNCTSLVNAPVLPSTTLANMCYAGMFEGCTALTTAPVLPATTISERCYESMFSGCTALTTAPELPATTLANMCYSGMFEGCTALTTAPVLPATTLVGGCYGAMFSGCTALATAPALPATTLADSCYMGMFFMCSSLVNAPELPATTLAERCYYNMFSGCTSLTQAPVLPATTLANYCYQSMFKNCTNLQYVKCLSTDITATDALTDWLSGVATTGTFFKEYGVEYLINSPSGIPEGWTVIEPKYMTITVLDGDAGETTISPTVTGLIKPNLQYRINNGEWSDFIVGTTADIHAVTGDVIQWKGVNERGISTSDKRYLIFDIYGNYVALSGNVMSLIDGIGDTKVIPCSYCFYNLFKDTKIKTVSEDFLPATTLADNCYTSMFNGCQYLTQAPALPATTITPYCYASMFNGCKSLIKEPALPATTLAPYCYTSMFGWCSSLYSAPSLPATTLAEGCYRLMFLFCTFKTAPVLPATTLADSCYYEMFNNCYNLKYVKCLATNKSAPNCTYNWLSSVASEGTFVKASGTRWTTGADGIPKGWYVNEE